MRVCALGSFNAVASANEKAGWSSSLGSNNRAFSRWVQGAGLLDLGHQGPAYTWSNNQDGKSNIAERLDRVLASLQWTLTFPKSSVFHIPRFHSDHMLILLRMDPSPIRRNTKFQCNWWHLQPEFRGICELRSNKLLTNGAWSDKGWKGRCEIGRWSGDHLTQDSRK